jgi:mono/diheme cytochrome c family protein
MRKDLTRGLVVILATTLFPGLALAGGSVDKGKALYAQQCVSCHGSSGKGDGPAAAAMQPKPRNLADKAYMAGLTDQRLADVIKKGGAGVGKSPLMPPFGAALKDGDIQDVVAFIKNLEK